MTKETETIRGAWLVNGEREQLWVACPQRDEEERREALEWDGHRHEPIELWPTEVER